MTIKVTENDLQASQQPQSSPSKITVGDEVWSAQPYPVKKIKTPDTISTKPQKEMWILGGIVGGTLLLIVCFGIVLTAVNSPTLNHRDETIGADMRTTDIVNSPTLNHEAIAITKVNNDVCQIVTKIGKLDTDEKWEQMVREIRSVNLSGCPQDFKIVFSELIYCFDDRITFQEEWNELVKEINIKRSRLKDEAEAFKNSADSIETVLESLIRVAWGDPFGKVREIMDEEKVLKSKFQDLDIATQNEIEEFTKREKKIENKMREIIRQLERIATQYNAKFNCFKLL
jgi:hypothetical protein